MLQEKRCTKCNVIKPINKFNKQRDKKSGFTSHCKDCIYKKQKEYLLNLSKEKKNRLNEQKRLANRKWRSNLTIERKKELNNKCKEWHIKKQLSMTEEELTIERAKNAKYMKKHRKELPDWKKEEYKTKDREYSRRYRANMSKEQKEKTRLIQKKISRKWYLNLDANKREERKIKHRINMQELRRKNIDYKISEKLRVRIYISLKGYKRVDRTEKLLGCSIIFFKQYLERKFYKNMNWENHGKIWHIDHIIPCSSFNLSKPEEQRKCFHYSNMRPLLVTQNLKKYNKIPSNIQFTLL